jgi:hypothetical protein
VVAGASDATALLATAAALGAATGALAGIAAPAGSDLLQPTTIPKTNQIP